MVGMAATQTPDALLSAVNLRLGLLGLPRVVSGAGADEELIAPLLERQRELSRRLADRLPPIDERVQAFLDDYLDGILEVRAINVAAFLATFLISTD